MTNPERNTSPEYNVPTWEELLLGVVARKALSPDDPNASPTPAEGYFRVTKGFRMPDGNNLIAIGRSSGGVPTEWELVVFPSGGHDEGYTLELRSHEGYPRLFDIDSEIPLEATVAEHFLGQLMLAEPARGDGQL